MITTPLSSTPSLRLEVVVPRQGTAGTIQIALAVIISLGISASLVWVGCFRIQEDRSVALANVSEIVSFLESLLELIRFLS